MHYIIDAINSPVLVEDLVSFNHWPPTNILIRYTPGEPFLIKSELRIRDTKINTILGIVREIKILCSLAL